MDIGRVWRHLMMTRRKANRDFPLRTLLVIEQAIRAGETAHRAEIRFAVEGALQGTALFGGRTAHERALEVFSELRVWDTEQNNGVLIYVLLADRQVEIIADRGINAVLPADTWGSICRGMERAFGEGRFESGAIAGIQTLTRHLARHFPPTGAGRNELPDRPVVM